MERLLSQQRAVWLVSAFIVFILVSQFVTGVTRDTPGSWPITSYPMYRNFHSEGDRLRHAFDVRAVLEDGSFVPVSAEDVGMTRWLFMYNVVWPVENGRQERLDFATERYCRRTDGRLARFEVWDAGIAIGTYGPIEGLDPLLLGSAEVSCD